MDKDKEKENMKLTDMQSHINDLEKERRHLAYRIKDENYHRFIEGTESLLRKIREKGRKKIGKKYGFQHYHSEFAGTLWVLF